MTTETTRAKGKLTALSNSLDELESYLEPLFSQTLPETLVGLEPIQQAKVQTVVPYLVHDLVFIYLKLRGIDPKTHPVVPELDRVRQYFGKISSAENPPARRTEIDKVVASRFIKNAITQVKWTKTAAEEEDIEKPEASTSEKIPIKVTSKMQERAQYEKDIREMDARGEDDDDLVVFEGDEGAMESLDTQKSEESSSNKRRRPPVDPFAGYGDDAPEDSTTTSKKSKQTLPETNETSSSIAKTKGTRKKSKDEPTDANTGEGSKKRKTKKEVGKVKLT